MKKQLCVLSLSLFFVIVFSGITHTHADELSEPIISTWLEYPVEVDGVITSATEWEEVAPVDVKIGYISGDPPLDFNMRVWVKNDGSEIYFLYRIEWSSDQYDDSDLAGIFYFWSKYIPATGWDNSDGSIVGCSFYPALGGWTSDCYDYWDETQFSNDTEATPPGQNNVEGKGTHDGTYYWFEFKKPLNSGDGYDWNFELGETYGWYEGTPGKTDELIVFFSDESREVFSKIFLGYIKLTIAEAPPSPGGISVSLDQIATIITIGGAGVGIIGWTIRTRGTRKRKKILFKKLMDGVDGIFTRYKMNARQCETELYKLKDQVLNEFKHGMIDEENYTVLDRRINEYLKEIREEREKQ